MPNLSGCPTCWTTSFNVLDYLVQRVGHHRTSRQLFCLFVLCIGIAVHAQDNQFVQMKGELTEHSLPLVNLTVNAGTLNRTNFVPATMEIVHTPCFDDDTLQLVTYNCKLRIRGNTAAKFDKKSFAIKLVDDDGNDLDANLFDIREENSWILDAMAIDRIRMRNRVCFDVWNEMSNGTEVTTQPLPTPIVMTT